MIVRVGEHYRNTSRGRKLFQDVRQYSCPRGCPGTFFDFRGARPVGQPIRILGLIPVPKNTLNIIDPLLFGGLLFFYLMFVAGILFMGISLVFKVIALILITALGAMLLVFMGRTEDDPDETTPAGPASAEEFAE